jgi:hypothetical protein
MKLKELKASAEAATDGSDYPSEDDGAFSSSNTNDRPRYHAVVGCVSGGENNSQIIETTYLL